MKRKLTRAQGMVEYALLVTMIAVPMVVISATLGDAAGQVWQTIIDSLDDTAVFSVSEFTLGGTPTDISTEETSTEETPTDIPTAINTVDPFGPPTETPTETEVPPATEIPTETEIPPTATHFIPATMTFTASPVPPTETPTDIPTAVPTATPVYVTISKVESSWDGNTVTISLKVDVKKEWIYVLNLNSGATQTVRCWSSCEVSFYDSTHSGGYVTITSKDGDYINYFYPGE